MKTKYVEKLTTSHKNYKNPESIRNGNLVFKSLPVIFALICTAGIYWKRKRQRIRVKENYNVMTFNGTVLLVLLIYLDNILFSYLMLDSSQQNFTLEILRTIFIENLFFKCLIPTHLLLQSRTHLEALWVDTQSKKINFFLTSPSFIPRSGLVITETLNNQQIIEASTRHRPDSQHPLNMTITIHQHEDQENELPEIV